MSLFSIENHAVLAARGKCRVLFNCWYVLISERTLKPGTHDSAYRVFTRPVLAQKKQHYRFPCLYALIDRTIWG